MCTGCSTDAGCPSGSCDVGFTATEEKRIDCRLADSGLASLLGANGVTWMRCNDSSKWIEPGHGECRMEFFREQTECASYPLLIDAFFSCDATQCTQTVERKEVVKHSDSSIFGCLGAIQQAEYAMRMLLDPETIAPATAIESGGHNTATLTLMVLAGLLLVAFVLIGLPRVASVAQRYTGLSVWTGSPIITAKIGVFAVIMLILCIMLAVASSLDTTVNVESALHIVTTYNCETVSCTCGTTDTSQTTGDKTLSSCSDSVFGQGILPTIGAFSITCVDGWQQCKVTTDIKLPPITLSQCRASECIEEKMHREVEEEKGGSGRAFLYAELGVFLMVFVGAMVGLVWEICGEKKKRKQWESLYTPNSAWMESDEEMVSTQRTMVDTAGTGATPNVDEAEEVLFANISYRGNGGQMILDDISFATAQCRSVAIMGPSGSGKTSLLDIISLRTMSGSPTLQSSVCEGKSKEVYLKGLRYHRYDALVQALTVRQHLRFSCVLALPVAVRGEEREMRVSEFVKAFDLQKIEHQVISGSLSSGERRRVACAARMIAQPNYLFLDEPTSGLDTHTAKVIVGAITKGVAHTSSNQACERFFNSRPISVFSIHQPSEKIFAEFDLLMLMGNGRIIYYGPAKEAKERVSAKYPELVSGQFSNPADYLSEIAGRIAEDVTPIVVPCGIPDTALSMYPRQNADIHFSVGFYRKMYCLLHRNLLVLLNSHALLAGHCAVAFFFTLFISVLYKGQAYDLTGALNRMGVMTFLLLLVSLSSLSVIDSIVIERDHFKEERANQMYTSTEYYLTKLLLDWVFVRTVPTLCLTAFSYLSIGLRTEQSGPAENPFLSFVFVVVLFNLVITAMCASVAVVAPNSGSATLASILLILFFFLFNGPILQLDSVAEGLQWLRWTSPFALAFEVLMVNELAGLECQFAPTDAAGRDLDSTPSITILCEQYLANFDLEVDRVGADLGGLFAWLAFYLILGCIALHLFQKSTR